MTRVLLVLAALAAVVTVLLLASGAPFAHVDGWTWASPTQTKAPTPHGWKW